MKHLLPIICILFYLSHLSAQTSRWGIGTECSYDNIGLTNIDDKIVKVQKKGSLTGTVLVHYKASNRISISTGIGSRLMKYAIQDYRLNFACDHDGMGGFDPFNSYEIAHDDLRAFTFPLNATIYFGKKSNQFYVKPGLTWMKFFDDRPVLQLYECGDPTIRSVASFGVIKSSQMQTKLNVGYEFGLELPNNFLNRWRYQIELGASYFATPGFEMRFTESHFWSLGAAFGVRYNLRRASASS